jgi:hypothetical protein
LEQNREKDPGLNEAFREYEQVLESLKDSEILELRKKLRELREQDIKSGRRSRFMDGSGNWMWLAAVLTIVLSFTIIIGLLVRQLEDNATVASIIPMEKQSFENLNKELMKFGIRDHGMTLEIPKDHSIHRKRGYIRFQWSVDSTYNLLLDVIDREGNVVFVSDRPLESPYFFRKKMKSGMYIFRFRDDKEAFNLSVLYLK